MQNKPFLGLKERTGDIAGKLLGVATGATSFIRRSRMFHPRGITYLAQVETIRNELSLPPFALLRFSSAWWKDEEWMDVLGVAIRFSESPDFIAQAKEGDQDLLFATIQSPWTLPFAPLTTRFHDFLDNEYFAVTPFSQGRHAEQLFKLSLHSLYPSPAGKSREHRLDSAVAESRAIFELRMLNLNHRSQNWRSVASIQLKHRFAIDQARLRFDPFRTGRGIVPRGLVHHLRIGAYSASQLMRSFWEKSKHT